MKHYILFICYFLFINLNISAAPFAAFFLDEETQENLAGRVKPIVEPLVDEALTRFPGHSKTEWVKIDHETLDVDPRILDFSLENDLDESKLHMSLSLQNIVTRSLGDRVKKAKDLIPRCLIRTTGAKEMGRYIAISLAVDPSPLKDKANEDLVNYLTRNAHVSVAKFTDAQRDFIYLKSAEIGEKKAEDMFENISSIFRAYTEDMRTLTSQYHDSSADGMEMDSESPPTTPQKSPLGKGGRPPRRPLVSLQAEGTISPRKSPDRVCKKTDLSPSTLLSQVFLSPSRAKAGTSKKSLAPQQLFSDSPAAAAAPVFSTKAILKPSPSQVTRAIFLEEISVYAQTLASELAKQTESNKRQLDNFPPVAGLNISLINKNRNKHLPATQDGEFIKFLSYGIQVQLLGLFNGAIEAEHKGKENVYRGKWELYHGKESLELSPHKEILSQQDSPPISMAVEGSRLEGLRSYLHEIYKVDYKEESVFNEKLSSLVPNGEVWQSQIDLLNQEMRVARIPITLGDFTTARIP